MRVAGTDSKNKRVMDDCRFRYVAVQLAAAKKGQKIQFALTGVRAATVRGADHDFDTRALFASASSSAPATAAAAAAPSISIISSSSFVRSWRPIALPAGLPDRHGHACAAPPGVQRPGLLWQPADASAAAADACHASPWPEASLRLPAPPKLEHPATGQRARGRRGRQQQQQQQLRRRRACCSQLQCRANRLQLWRLCSCSTLQLQRSVASLQQHAAVDGAAHQARHRQPWELRRLTAASEAEGWGSMGLLALLREQAGGAEAAAGSGDRPRSSLPPARCGTARAAR